MRRHLFPALFIALSLFALPAVAQSLGDGGPRIATINLTGVGEVTAAPDMATLTSGVVSQADTARDALDANNASAAKLMSLMRDSGIADRDIQTSNFSIQPLYERNNNDNVRRNPKIVGYQVSNSISVRVRDLTMLGAILDSAVSVGANTIDGIIFSVSDTAALFDEARRQAVTDAVTKAELYTSAAGVKLVRIIEITESDYGRPQEENFAMARMAADSVSVPMAAGELNYSSRVNIVWEIADD